MSFSLMVFWFSIFFILVWTCHSHMVVRVGGLLKLLAFGSEAAAAIGYIPRQAGLLILKVSKLDSRTFELWTQMASKVDIM